MTCVKVELTRQNRKAGVTLSAMNTITQDMRCKAQTIIIYDSFIYHAESNIIGKTHIDIISFYLITDTDIFSIDTFAE